MASTEAAATQQQRGSRGGGKLYRGDLGMWSWVAHRITGVLTFFFLFVHVLDTALVRVSPEAYDKVIATYKEPFFVLFELGLVAAVLFHALNGIRVMLVDFWGKGPRFQRPMMWTVLVIWAALMIPGSYHLLAKAYSMLMGGM
ncbi:succinate dehydrogenase, cytochrome b556 subunit [Crossiella cryophila]|uniref:Succinate dehydrogenase / fumarate reductase cytochrome b subunit n=1 Tax=Crossiella cryophila TaxID=43355 RepID=A0A7W7C707_9PSEU|nr:succinate dehydrogenase, cytochrome b556 subunit [Crossiella cryophila]MBB4675685.1 succinate dehydrogenase / fumarate reductase cytochrome b subunit [Crossiella cryophila]